MSDESLVPSSPEVSSDSAAPEIDSDSGAELESSVSEESSPEELSDSDREELEYQEAMRRIREGKSPDAEDEEDEPKKDSKKDKKSKEDADKKKAEDKKEEPKKPDIAKFKLKGGKEIEIDLNNRETVTGLIQKGIGATEAFQEASEMRKNAEAFVSALQKDPFRVLQHPSLKLDVRKMAEEYLWGQIQMEKMSPEERALKEKEEKLRAYEEAEKMRKEEESRKIEEARKAKQREYWTGLISTSLDKHGLPKIPWTIEETAKRMKLALEHGYKDVTPDDIVPAVKEDWLAMRKNIFENLDGDQLVNVLGKDVATKISKAELKKYKTSKFENKAAAPEPKESTRTYKSMEELQHSLRTKYR